MRGHIEWMDEIKGYGVIAPEAAEAGRFFFLCDSAETIDCSQLREGDEVEFESVPKGQFVESLKIRKTTPQARSGEKYRNWS